MFLLATVSVLGVDYRLGDPISYKNTIIWPVLISETLSRQSYLSLDEGIATGNVAVAEFGTLEPEEEGEESEAPGESAEPERLEQPILLPEMPQDASAEWMYQNQTNMADQYDLNQYQLVQQMVQSYGSGAMVNELHIQNNSDKPLFIMAGEIIKGGKQNRVVNQDIIVPPHSEPVVLSVFCVEQGRWQPYREGESPDYFASGKQLVAQNSLRKTVVHEAEQSKVWAKVAELNTSQESTSETSDYTKNLEDIDRMKMVEEYLGAVRAEMAEGSAQGAVVGVIVAVNCELYGGDIILDGELFTALLEKILTFYFIEAVVNIPEKQVRVDWGKIHQDAMQFLHTATDARGEEAVEQGAGYQNVSVQMGDISVSYLVVGSGSSRLRLHQVFFAK